MTIPARPGIVTLGVADLSRSVSFYAADPDGHPWEIAHNPHFPIDAEGRVHIP